MYARGQASDPQALKAFADSAMNLLLPILALLLLTAGQSAASRIELNCDGAQAVDLYLDNMHVAPCGMTKTRHTVHNVVCMASPADCHVIVDFLQKALRDEPQRREHDLAGDVR